MRSVSALLLLVLLALAIFALTPLVSDEEPRQRDSMDNLRDLAGMQATLGRWPRFGGKAFVLAVVARGGIHPKNERGLRTLFAPDEVPPHFATFIQRFEAVSWKSLREGLDVSALTSYAGRRNDEEPYRLTQKSAEEEAAIYADIHSIPDHAIVAFADGSVTVLGRAELGLERDDPIVVGEAARSPLLRALSDR